MIDLPIKAVVVDEKIKNTAKDNKDFKESKENKEKKELKDSKLKLLYNEKVNAKNSYSKKYEKIEKQVNSKMITRSKTF